MKYDFTKIIDRKGKDATSIDGIGQHVWGIAPDPAKPGFDEIPMWVADMNFETCPSVTKALEERIRHPLYGYFLPSDQYYQSIIDWQTSRHDWKNLSREMIGYENGVHGGIMSTIEVLTEPGDPILVHSPTYAGFIDDLNASGRRAVFSPLVHDAEGIWRMDYRDMEEKILREHVHLAIFCSPQNPTGRVWERSEIEAAMDLFRKYEVTVISDEIWSDIVFGGYRHIPTCMISEDAAQRTVALYAPSKTFNLAGLIGSYHIIPNPLLRERITGHGKRTNYNEMNVLSMHALIGAYSSEGQEWTDELNQVLEENCRYVIGYVNSHFPGCHIEMPQGTYMLFMECNDYLKQAGMEIEELIKKGWDVGVAWESGEKFAWHNAIRLNTALPVSRLQEAMERLEKYVFTA